MDISEVIQLEIVCRSYRAPDFGACRIHVISELDNRTFTLHYEEKKSYPYVTAM